MAIDSPSTPDFETEDQAWDWLYETVVDLNTDNGRFAYVDDDARMVEYAVQQSKGCCGEADYTITINAREATIGCNYGH